MIIIGVDMSTTNLGWAAIKDNKILDYGICKCPDKDWRVRIRSMTDQFIYVLPSFTMLDDIRIFIEEPEVMGMAGRMTGSNMQLASACYFLSGVLYARRIPHELVGVRAWKGNLPKSVVFNRLSEYYGIESMPCNNSKSAESNDAVDAIGIAHWAVNRS